MANLFNQDFIEFIQALNNHHVEYILVGGYAVILHGYTRSTADMDVWVNKTSTNYEKLVSAYRAFGAPIFSKDEFLSNKHDVWSIGTEPCKIEVLSGIKGVIFDEVFSSCETYRQDGTEVRYIHLRHLLQAKEAAGRFRDKDDIEQLNIRNKGRN